LQANCIRCHESTVEFINHERVCWECHRRLIHTRSGSMETI
jgi:cytochrome c nitrite reductase small subunit